jgi:hypothetical protein
MCPMWCVQCGSLITQPSFSVKVMNGLLAFMTMPKTKHLIDYKKPCALHAQCWVMAYTSQDSFGLIL